MAAGAALSAPAALILSLLAFRPVLDYTAALGLLLSRLALRATACGGAYAALTAAGSANYTVKAGRPGAEGPEEWGIANSKGIEDQAE
ncbi:hypothetical protein [Moorella sp. E308F]|uniref:hypothetical protein n=1 Tax=Moorella sp. E308F TaxID=2572682 RepID=UPI001141DC13|nr:hypothetical protein [Moorella sp. E308F]